MPGKPIDHTGTHWMKREPDALQIVMAQIEREISAIQERYGIQDVSFSLNGRRFMIAKLSDRTTFVMQIEERPDGK